MKITKALKNLIEDFKASDLYWTEAAKLQFAVNLEKQRKIAGITYKTIAERIGSSAAYVSKVFRGDSNLTIESMVKLARASGGHLDVRISTKSIEVSDWSKQWIVGSGDFQNKPKTTALIYDFKAGAAKNDKYWREAA